MMDNFRNKPGEVQEAVFLDDPTLSCLDVSDFKNFLDVGESNTSNSRYSPAKFTRNQLRAVCDNEFNEEDEPEPDNRIQITAEEFYKVAQKAFGYAKKPHVMAILKRAICGIAGKHAFYLRLPSQYDDAPIFRITLDEIVKDWLIDPGNKYAYSEYKRGKQVYYPGFEANVTREQKAIDEGFQQIEGKNPKGYIASVNKTILDMLRSQQGHAEAEESTEGASQAASQPPGETSFQHIPSTPARSQPQPVMYVPLERDGSWMIPHTTTGPSSSKRARFSVDFSIRRRVSSKTSDPGIGAVSSSSDARGAFESSAAASQAAALRSTFDDPEADALSPSREDGVAVNSSDAAAFAEPPDGNVDDEPM